MIKQGLDAARQKWIGEAKTDLERQHRESSDFLRYKNSDGLFVDFHALRHTRGVWLFEHHKATGRDVQDLMGIGSLALVDRYSRRYKPAHGELVTRGPRLPEIKTKNVSKSGVPTFHLLPVSLLQTAETRRILTDSGERFSRWTVADFSGPRRSESPEIPGVLTPRAESDTISN